MAYRGHIPYSPQTDPKALFAQGLGNFLAGLNEQRESKRFGQAVGGVDPQAGVLQAIGQMLSGGATPQQAMGVGKMMPTPASPSQQISQHKLDRINMLKERVGAGTATVGEKAALDKMLEGTPLVQFGNMPWQGGVLGPEAMAARAEKEQRDRMGLSATQLSNARKGVKTLVRETPDKWAPGWSDYSRDTLLDVYKQYRVENDYKSKSIANRAKLDEIFDGQIETYNRVGHPNVMGKNEFDWDPKDARVVALRKKETEQEDMSRLSDEELKRIAEGG